LQAAGALAASAADPVGDCHGSAAFRRHLAAVLTRRALATAISRAEERNA
jgi:aerobic carbon-monoxide dehydrogenase medium subunit